MSVTGTEVTPGGTFKYSDVISSVRVKLRDTNSGNWEEADLMDLLNDGIMFVRRRLSFVAPEMIWERKEISLTYATAAGPYSLPDDFEREVKFLNDFGQDLHKGQRNDYAAAQSKGRPDEYALDGYNPTKAYFNRGPASGESYTYVLFYIQRYQRQNDSDQTIPLPYSTYEVLEKWTTIAAGDIDEYNTIDDEQKLARIGNLMDNILVMRANPIEFEIEEELW